MKKAPVVLLLVLLAAATLSASVLKITVNAPIHPVTSEYIRQAVDRAAEGNHDLLVLVLNTPGGLDSSMREIIEKILSSPVPVAAYVSPSGSRSASAGFFIAVACDIFAMAPGTNTGSASPVGVSLTGQEMDETMSKKVTNDAASFIKSIAEKRGRNTAMAEAAVRTADSYTEQEALEGGLIDLVAGNLEDVLSYADGRT
ncbi:MAG: ATP-dependent Clp protease proteolytic subunit, partial [Acidobacteria bacterium]|nr:ATP-dependent Clp protease proteolytic subunit [Acidobacteriota bacterium]